jgi:Putative Actinobacterial Holin-X, holin superfamily III
MMDKHSIPPRVNDEDTPSPRVQIAALVTDVQSLAKAEWDYAKARLSYSGGVARKAGIYALLAIMALSAAAIALVLGTLMIIASYWGPWIATVAVVILSGFAAAIFAVSARNTARNLKFSGDDGDDG